MPGADPKSRGMRRILESGTRAQRWLVGLVLAGVAAAVTGYVTSAITSGVDRVQGSLKKARSPIALTVDRSIQVRRSSKLGFAHYVFTRPIASIPYPTSGDLRYIPAWDAWARRQGGLDADSTGIQVVIEGTTQFPVVLTGLTVDITRRALPPKGAFVVPFGGGPLGVRYFAVNLDANPPAVTSVPAEFSNDPAIDFPYRVSQAEPEVLNIVAHTQKCDCEWRALLHWVYHGKSDVTMIDNGGRPFRTVSSSRSALYYANHGRFTRG